MSEQNSFSYILSNSGSKPNYDGWLDAPAAAKRGECSFAAKCRGADARGESSKET